MIRRRALAVLFVLSIPIAAEAQSKPAAPPDLDAYVARVLRAFEVPGAALTIVKDGETVVAKGYGVRRLGVNEPVDGRTLFGIASNTKVFTATALALLVEEGKIEWDAPVRDLLVHRSGLGLGAGDLLWWPPSTYDRPEIARRIRFIKPATSFRSAYAYDNVLYLVAGELITAITGQTWEDFVHLARSGESRDERLERPELARPARPVRRQRGGDARTRRRPDTADRSVRQ
jgi:CubicO group peptidase (beta-lactamase class C family)